MKAKGRERGDWAGRCSRSCCLHFGQGTVEEGRARCPGGDADLLLSLFSPGVMHSGLPFSADWPAFTRTRGRATDTKAMCSHVRGVQGVPAPSDGTPHSCNRNSIHAAGPWLHPWIGR